LHIGYRASSLGERKCVYPDENKAYDRDKNLKWMLGKHTTLVNFEQITEGRSHSTTLRKLTFLWNNCMPQGK
jgi:hypothetical protein